MSKHESSILKGIAIVLMLYHHLFFDPAVSAADGAIYGLASVDAVGCIVRFSKVCVALFVFVTGYGITRSIMRSESERIDAVTRTKAMESLFVRRLVKLLLPFQYMYIVAFFFCLIASCLLGIANSPEDVYGQFGLVSFVYAFIDFMGLANAFGTPTLNGTWWYMSFAILLVCLVPLLNKLSVCFGSTMMLLSSFMASFFGSIASSGVVGSFWWYLLTVSVGCWCARTNFFEKILKKTTGGGFFRAALSIAVPIAVIALFAAVREAFGGTLYWITEAFLSVSLASIVVIAAKMPVLRTICKPFDLLGKHSMDIFLVHSFFYAIFFREFIFMPRYWLLILLLLIGVSLIASYCLGFLRKMFRMKALEERLIKTMVSLSMAHSLSPAAGNCRKGEADMSGSSD